MNIFKKTTFLVLLVVSLSLQSCFVAKEYVRPELATENLYRNVHTNDSVTMASMPWEALFTDAKLQTLIHEVLKNNLDLQMAVTRVNAAESYYKQGKAGFLPSVNVSANAGDYRLADNSVSGVSNGGVGPEYQNYQLGASLSWEADIWGKIRSQKRASQAVYLKSEAGQRVVESKLVASTASGYYQLLALDAQLKVAKQTVQNRAEGLQTMIDLKEVGRVPATGVKQAEAQLYATQILVLNLERNVHLLENTLSLLLGKKSGNIERSLLAAQEIKMDLSTGFSADLLRNRPDVMLAEFGLIQTFELTNVAKSNFYPSFKISAGGGFESVSFDNWFNTAAVFSNVVGNLTQPLFNKRKVKTQYEVAKAQQEEATLQFKKALLVAGKEVSDMLYVYQTEKQTYEYRVKELKALKYAVAYSNELLNSAYGNTTYLEVLTARDYALNSEINKIDSEFKQLNAVVNLYMSLGGGWKK